MDERGLICEMEVVERGGVAVKRVVLSTAVAARRVQAAFRKRLRRQRVHTSSFELGGLDAAAWGFDEPQPRRRSSNKCRRKCYRVLALFCVLFLAFGSYVAAGVVNLTSTAKDLCDGPSQVSCIKRVKISSLCSSRVDLALVIDWEWRPWSSVFVDDISVELRADSGAHALVTGSAPAITLSRSLPRPFSLNASLSFAAASATAPLVHRFLSSGDAEPLHLTAHATARTSPWLTIVPIHVTLPFTATVTCSNFTCSLRYDGEDSTSTSPPPPPASPSSSWSLGSFDISTPSSSALLSLAASLQYNQSLATNGQFPQIEMSLPAIEASLSCATPPDEAWSHALVGTTAPPPDAGAAVVRVDGTSAVGGMWSTLVHARLLAETDAQGVQLRGMAHAALVCGRGEGWCSTAPTVYARFQDGKACYLSQVLHEMPPLALPLAYTSPHLGQGSSSTLINDATVALHALNETRIDLDTHANVDIPWQLTGELPPFELTAESAGGGSIGFLRNEQPISLSHLPALSARLSLGVTADAVSLAASLLKHNNTATNNTLEHLLESYSIGAPSTAPLGLPHLRVPLSWLITPADLPATKPPSTQSPKVRVEALTLDATEGLDHAAAASASAFLDGVGSMPRWLRVSSGGALNVSLACEPEQQQPRPPDGESPPPPSPPAPLELTAQPFAIAGNGSVALQLTMAGTPLDVTRMPQACSDIHASGSLGGRRGALLLSLSTARQLIDAWSGSGSNISSVGRTRTDLAIAAEPNSTAAVAAFAVSLPFTSPVQITLPPLNLTLRDSNATGVPLATMGIDTGDYAAGDDMSIGGFLLLSFARRGAMARILHSVIEQGDPTTLCVTSTAVSACVHLEGSGPSSNYSWFDNATIELIGPSTIEVQCVFPFDFCPQRTRQQLQQLPPSFVSLQVEMPLPHPIKTLLDDYNLHVAALPPTSLDLGIDYFASIGTLLLPSFSLSPTTKHLSLAVNASVLDWYALSRATHPFGRAIGAEHRNRTLRISGSNDCSLNWACVLPELYSIVVPPPSGNGSTFILPTLFNVPHPSPSDPPPWHLLSTSDATAAFTGQVGFDSPLPVTLIAQKLGASILFSSGTAELHRVVDLAPVDTSAPLVLPPSLSHINIKANLYAERGAKCAVPECYTPGATDPPACLQKMCALGQLIERYSSSETLAVTLKASVMSAKGGVGTITLSTDLEMYGDRTQQLDRAAMFLKRDTTMWSNEEYQLLHPNPLGGLIYNELEIMDTIEESVLHGLFEDKPIDAYMKLNLTNVFAVPLALTHYVIGGLFLIDADGVLPHAVLRAAVFFENAFPPDNRHPLGGRFTSKVPNPDKLLQPGQKNQVRPTVPMYLSTVVRYQDEMYMKNQNCLDVDGGRADLLLRAAPSQPPFSLTFGFAPQSLGFFKRRACHLPANVSNACEPTRRPADRNAEGCGQKGRSCAFRGSAVPLPGGGVRLLTKAQKKQSGSGFWKSSATFLDGFSSTFTFEMRRECTPGLFSSCQDLSGGFTFVLAPEIPAGQQPPLGGTCEVTATVVQAGMYNPDIPTLVMSNDTTISCAGYGGLTSSSSTTAAPQAASGSIGLIFSLETGHNGNRYWMIDTSLPLKGLSDWPRASMSLFVNGEVKNTTTADGAARGIAQHGGEVPFLEGTHTVKIEYSAAMRMLYVTLDDSVVPDLWAELNPADLGLGPRPNLTAGFTAAAPSSGEGISIDITNWALKLTNADSKASRLLEAGQVVGAVGERTAVHIDARESCGLPRVTGGLTWIVTIKDASGAGGLIFSIEDLGDGTSRVSFVPKREGRHQLVASLWSETFEASFDVRPARLP